MGERQQLVRPEDMAGTSTAVATVPPQLQEEPVERVAVITLRQPSKEPRKKVVWTEDTIDNENMNKKKSKCCCIYEKPRKFGESDSEDSDDECDHCYGHVEKRKTTQQTAQNTPTTITQEAPPAEPTAALTLHPSEPAPAAPPDKQPIQ